MINNIELILGAELRLAVCRYDGINIDRAQAQLVRAGLPEAECNRLQALRNPQARAASVAARMALLWALEETRGVLSLHDTEETVPHPTRLVAAFVRTEQGPLLEGSDFRISLAHSAKMAVCAVAKGRRVGVDVEPLDREMHVLPDMPPLFSQRECVQLAAAPDRDREFLRIWTRKEALGKALGTGLHHDKEALDTTAYPADCFAEQIVEGELVTVFLSPQMDEGGKNEAVRARILS